MCSRGYPPSSESLPQEVLDEIAFCCGQSTLLNLAVVSKAWGAAAQSALFHAIGFATSGDYTAETCLASAEYTTIHSLKKLFRALRTPESHLRSKVVALLVVWPPTRNSYGKNFRLVPQLLATFATLHCLQTMQVHVLGNTESKYSRRPSVPSPMPVDVPTSTKIELNDNIFNFQQLFYLDSLRHVVFQGDFDRYPWLPRNTDRCSSVTSLRLTEPGPPGQHFANLLAWMRCLRCLDIYPQVDTTGRRAPETSYGDISIEDLLRMLQPHKLHLQHLKWAVNIDQRNIVGKITGTQLMEFKSLKSLSLPCEMFIPSLEQVENIALDEVIPKRLVNIKLDLYPCVPRFMYSPTHVNALFGLPGIFESR